MKFSEKWLREWVNPRIDTHELGNLLTSLGLEVETIESFDHDNVFELGITPNRGDCLSIQGVAREVSVATQTAITPPVFEEVDATLTDELTIDLRAKAACPRYCGRIIRNVNASAPTPDWMIERLAASNVQSVCVIVDIGNFVMLELGQPLHVFDLDKLNGNIHIRMSKNETVTLIDETKAKLADDDLVICDDNGIVALAGVMGGLDSAVTAQTKNVFIESAFFAPEAIAGRARRVNVRSDGSQRFERGVDPDLCVRAMARVTQLICEFAGGEVGPVTEVIEADFMPGRETITLEHDRINTLLGLETTPEKVSGMLQALNMDVSEQNGVYTVTPPSYRFDIHLPQDLIEEVARLIGYDNIPEQVLPATPSKTVSETENTRERLASCLIDRGYHEVITYSFVDKNWQEQLFPGENTQDLLNPISQDMGSMRLSIWPGLLKTIQYNQNRQMSDLRLFEMGQCFFERGGQLVQEDKLAGAITGKRAPLGWANSKDDVDFFDIKGDLEALFDMASSHRFTIVPNAHSALHPGQSAEILCDGKSVGWLGALHPKLAQALDLKQPIYLFEVDLACLEESALPVADAITKFPAIRRDIAVVVSDTVAAEALMALAREKAGELLNCVEIFDVYQGEHIEKGKKSVALGLILQDSSRTLIDEEVNDLMQAVVQGLEKTFQATVRE